MHKYTFLKNAKVEVQIPMVLLDFDIFYTVKNRSCRRPILTMKKSMDIPTKSTPLYFTPE